MLITCLVPYLRLALERVTIASSPLSNSSRPAMTWTHLHLLQVTPFALLIPVCLHALEEQLHQYKPVNISSGCWVHFPIWFDE